MLSKNETDKIFGEYGIKLSDKQYGRLLKYSDMLIEKNKVMNLTAITDDEGVTVKHFFDSIYPFTLFEPKPGANLIDVGTGAGFPSCPLKIFRDDINITLLDSLNKRVKFLEEVSDEIGLGAQCIHGRAEEFGRKDGYRESFDIACARAVANLTTLCEYCLPFVKVGGFFAALKGSGGEAELEAAKPIIKELGGKTEKLISYKLPGGDGRTLVIIKKLSTTPQKYPRSASKIRGKQ